MHMHARPGDRLVVKSHRVGERTDAGILEVHGEEGNAKPTTSSDGPTTAAKVSSSREATPPSTYVGRGSLPRGSRPRRLPRHSWERRGRAEAVASPDPTWVLKNTRSLTLHDGTECLLRPIIPQDKALLLSVLNRMSVDSRYMRFHHAKCRLSRAELRYLTEVDYEDHFAWCAFIVDDSGPVAVGVARYIRVAPMSDHAEVTAEVVDDYQGRGLGAILLRELARTAMEHGIGYFIAYVHPKNFAVIRWAQESGGSFVREHGVRRLELPLLEIESVASGKLGTDRVRGGAIQAPFTGR